MLLPSCVTFHFHFTSDNYVHKEDVYILTTATIRSRETIYMPACIFFASAAAKGLEPRRTSIFTSISFCNSTSKKEIPRENIMRFVYFAHEVVGKDSQVLFRNEYSEKLGVMSAMDKVDAET